MECLISPAARRRRSWCWTRTPVWLFRRIFVNAAKRAPLGWREWPVSFLFCLSFLLFSFFFSRLVRQAEVDCDLCLDFDRLAIQQVWLILPALDGVGGGTSELLIAAQYF